jgi:glycosyltransferase involved in cell wall biosynthesis
MLMRRLRPRGCVTINHEIVEPPCKDSPAGMCARELDVTVANSRKVAQLMSGFWPEKTIKVIPFLTSDHPMPAPARTSAGEKGNLRVTYLGRLVSHKRPDELVRRWPSIIRQPGMAGARLDIYGYDSDGGMLGDLRAFVKNSGLEKQVTIHGEYPIDAVPEILAQTDLVVLPSLWEGLPLVLVESMSHGVPFVATDAGGTEEFGVNNPDVLVTGKSWAEFETGLLKMALKIKAGEIDPLRLHRWAEDRYGCETVSRQWLECLIDPQKFFGQQVSE